ncbi:menaquinone reductase iron-sulfur cluster-binding subunit QrcC [Desulfovibrio inopinatus]|uniref:menaquinone reductase iron-sulfur cluster-binding subunit QrcC n=1 Tax=Desulfovibrio inopinatus TaxID=102109 RepID=UPI00041BFD1B|nr:menaquinone reductase iron-sulfur cluster-binding subunit QrcC [Desulfovibrio inopinatus]
MSAVKEFTIRWGMVIDIDKCTGCGACMVACQTENNIAPQPEASNKLRSLNWMLIYELNNKKSYPDHDMAYLPRPCQQCGNPPCVSVCPVIATDKNEEGGIVSQIYPRCIGCRYCVAACPYHVRYFGWFDPVFPEGMTKVLTPHTSVRPRGVVEKCTFCHHRWNYAKEKAIFDGKNPKDLPEDAYIPACVEGCPSGAMTFGDLNNPKHKVYELSRSKNAFRLLEKLHTQTQVYYMSRREWVRKQGDNYLANDKVIGGANHAHG